MFAGKARAYPIEVPIRVSSWLYPETLDYAEKACPEQISLVISCISKLRPQKSFITMDPADFLRILLPM
jgi:hypothetical protein